MSPKRVAGIDEAGRGPVIGPLVVAGIVMQEHQLPALKEWGIRDSKLLTARQRERLEPAIQRVALQTEILEISALEIDMQRGTNRTLNQLEAQWMAQILKRLDWDIAYVDAVDVNESRYGQTIQSYLKKKKEIISKHQADTTYPIVAAASIIAKVRRDQRIRELHQKYGDFGSGYPNDPKTQKFLQDWIVGHEKFPEIVRQTWETARRILRKTRQRRL